MARLLYRSFSFSLFTFYFLSFILYYFLPFNLLPVTLAYPFYMILLRKSIVISTKKNEGTFYFVQNPFKIPTTLQSALVFLLSNPPLTD